MNKNYTVCGTGLGIWPVGPTSAAVAGRAFQVLAFINTLHQQILSSMEVTQAFKDAWGNFYRVAANYLVVAVHHPIALSTGDVQTRIEAFASQAIEWRQAFVDAGGHPVGPAIPEEKPPDPLADFMKGLKGVLWALAGVVGVGAVGYTIVKWRRGQWKWPKRGRAEEGKRGG